MSREIKFRAWNPRLKQMSAPFSFEDLLKASVTLLHKTSFDEEIIYMQFIGHNDKNRIPACEGDIVRFKNWNQLLEIVWNEELACFEFSPDSDLPIFRINKDTKVIGNIYENPELLTPPG